MILSKRQKKLWIILVVLAASALILTSMMPFLYSFFK